ncbi:MAG: hypothetical protein E7256_17325 [Lachnospiraceae bacterium]|nr:hypothetical protein [Lachnospiraceae bacterium]
MIALAVGTAVGMNTYIARLNGLKKEKEADVIAIGTWRFRFIGISFLPMVPSLIFLVFFQALGQILLPIILCKSAIMWLEVLQIKENG